MKKLPQPLWERVEAAACDFPKLKQELEEMLEVERIDF